MINSFKNDYKFLSNFYPCLVSFEGVNFPSVEHAFQAAKTLNTETRQVMTYLATPGIAKKVGRTLNIREDWNEVRIPIMTQLVIEKFSRDPLKKWLLSTIPEELIEGNTWNDTFWGVCNGVGQNMLGKILMEVRDKFSKE